MIDYNTYKKNEKKWYKDYIENIDINSLTWQKLNALEFKKFLMENYYDYDECCYVASLKSIRSSANPFGLHYTSLKCINDFDTFFISSSLNNKMTNTIISCISLIENFKDQFTGGEYTFINYVEVNKYFQKMGMLKLMAYQLPNYINLNRDILITSQSAEGSICRVHNHLYLGV